MALSECPSSDADFLRGGGELGALMRNHDWASTSLGAPREWPRSLKTAIRLILNTGHPMYVWWGPDLLCFYNDAYSRTLGPERHPSSLGQPGREVWAEIWPLVGHQIESVLNGGGSTWDENRLVPITRHGVLEEIYWTYSYSPIDDETAPGGVGGVLVVCSETTQAVMAERQRAAEAARQRRLFEQAPGFITILTGPDHTFEFVNAAYRRLFGDRNYVGLTVRQAFPELADQEFSNLLDRVFTTGQRLVAEQVQAHFSDPAGGPDAELFLNFIYEPIVDETGQVTGIFVEGQDVTERVRAEARLREAEERYLALFNALDQGFCAIEVAFDDSGMATDYRFLEVSPSFERQTGIQNAAGRWMREIAPDEDPFWFEAYGRVAKSGEPARFENYSTALDRWWDVYAFRLSGQNRVGLLFHDITEQKRSQETLRQSEARLAFLDRLSTATARLASADQVLAATTRLLGEHLKLSVCAYADMDANEDGFTIRGDWAAPGSTSIVGHYSLADFGKLAVERLSAGQPLIINDNLREIAPEEAATFQNIGISATICMPLVKEGRLTALMAIHDRRPRTWTDEELGLLREVTARSWAHVERVAAVAALSEREERLSLAVENAEVGFWDLDLINDELIWPARTKGMFGISPDVPVTMADFYAGLHPEDLEKTSAAFTAATDPVARALYDVEYRTVGKEDGVVRWIAAKGRGVFDDSGKCLRVAGTAINVSARKAAEVALRESETRLRELNQTLERRVAEALAGRRVLADVIDGSDIFVQVVDLDYNWMAINRAAAAEFSRIYRVPTPAAGDNMLAMLAGRPEDVAAVRAVWSRALTGEEFIAVDEFGDPSLDRRYYEMRFRPLHDGNGKVAGAYQFVSDVTDRLREQHRLRDAEEALRQSQKMEAMGQLTGGVAHDFNNLLTPIIGSLDRLQRKGFEDERERRLIDGAMQSAERARTLVQRLLAFARRQPLQTKAVDVGSLLEGLVDLIESTLGPRIHFSLDIAQDLPAAAADENQIEMAVLNLAVNARDAMTDGGNLTVSARLVAVEETLQLDIPPGDYVCIAIADSGRGMDEETLARAVEPFFSTKGIGQGTGLGLSMVHGLAAQLGGALSIQSQVGVGTRIELYLPPSDELAPALNAPAGQEAKRACGTVLLVDDEVLIRMSTADLLSDLGYTVVDAGSAEQALRLVAEGQQFDILVTDHLMPGLSGIELAHALREKNPELPVLVISGYADIEGLDASIPRLVKPFRLTELSAKLAQLT